MSDDAAPTVDSLPDTKLKVSSGELTKTKKRGGTLSWELAKMESVSVGRTLNPLSIGLIGSACGILYLRWTLSLSTWLAIPIYLFVGLMAMIGLLMITSPVIRFRYPDQGAVRIACEESFEDVQKFMELIQKRHQKS